MRRSVTYTLFFCFFILLRLVRQICFSKDLKLNPKIQYQFDFSIKVNLTLWNSRKKKKEKDQDTREERFTKLKNATIVKKQKKTERVEARFTGDHSGRFTDRPRLTSFLLANFFTVFSVLNRRNEEKYAYNTRHFLLILLKWNNIIEVKSLRQHLFIVILNNKFAAF